MDVRALSASSLMKVFVSRAALFRRIFARLSR
jgi:hypothetical protein